MKDSRITSKPRKGSECEIDPVSRVCRRELSEPRDLRHAGTVCVRIPNDLGQFISEPGR